MPSKINETIKSSILPNPCHQSKPPPRPERERGGGGGDDDDDDDDDDDAFSLSCLAVHEWLTK